MISVPEAEDRKTEKAYWKKLAENFPNLGKVIDIQSPEA